MAGIGDGTDPSAAIGELVKQLEQADSRLKMLEQKLADQDRERAKEQRHNETEQQKAKDQTKLVKQQIAALDTLLTSGLAARPLTFDDLRKDQDLPAPDPARYEVRRRLSHRLPYGAERYESERQKAQGSYESARTQHEQQVIEATQWNINVKRQQEGFAARKAEAVEWFITEVLSRSKYPKAVPRQYRVSYQPEQAAIGVDLELPPPQSVPQEAEYQYQKPNGIQPVRRSDGVIRQQYKRLIAGIALRVAHEVFSSTSFAPDVVQQVALTGWCTGREEAVGESCTALLVSVSAGRNVFTNLILEEDQAVKCLTSKFGGRISPYPFGLVSLEYLYPPS